MAKKKNLPFITFHFHPMNFGLPLNLKEIKKIIPEKQDLLYAQLIMDSILWSYLDYLRDNNTERLSSYVENLLFYL